MQATGLPLLNRLATGLMAMALIASTSPCAVAADQLPDTAVPVLIRHARVFDGQRLLPTGTEVLVSDGRIFAVGAHLPLPAGARSVDATGQTLLPGLIDAHTHSWGTARADALRFGVTTELEMFGDPRELAAAREQRASRKPTALADLWSAGILATVPGGHGTQYGLSIPTLTGPGGAAAFVQARVAEGSDFLKIVLEDGTAYGQSLPTLDLATVQALVKAAHDARRQAVAHVATEAGASTALQAGTDGLVHVFMDQPATPDVVRLAVRSKAFVVATLTVAAGASGQSNGPALAADARLQPSLNALQIESLRAAFPPGWQKPQLLQNALENVRRLHSAGVPILAGTDAGNPGTAHGVSMHGELAWLVQAGLTPVQALAAATSLPARHFGLDDRGRIAAGQRADLLLVQGDPTRTIENSRAIVSVWKNGAEVDRRAPAAERPAAAPAAPDSALIADFEDGTIAVRFGQNWMPTTDQMAGGQSTAMQAWQAGGAAGSKGALKVQGRVDAGLAYAWAGTMFMPGAQPFEAVDFSRRQTLVFQVRGSERAYSAMIFSGAASQRMPAVVAFKAGPQWAEVRIPLSQFQGAKLDQLRALAFTAGLPAGEFSFEIDDVRIE